MKILQHSPGLYLPNTNKRLPEPRISSLFKITDHPLRTSVSYPLNPLRTLFWHTCNLWSVKAANLNMQTSQYIQQSAKYTWAKQLLNWITKFIPLLISQCTPLLSCSYCSFKVTLICNYFHIVCFMILHYSISTNFLPCHFHEIFCICARTNSFVGLWNNAAYYFMCYLYSRHTIWHNQHKHVVVT